MKPRKLDNITYKDAKDSGWNILRNSKFELETLGKAIFNNDQHKIMKSTKRFKVPGGWIYNITTEVHQPNMKVSIAEACTFVPDKSVNYYDL